MTASKCVVCHREAIVASSQKACVSCLRNRPDEALPHALHGHAYSRQMFGLPASPPKTAGGLTLRSRMRDGGRRERILRAEDERRRPSHNENISADGASRLLSRPARYKLLQRVFLPRGNGKRISEIRVQAWARNRIPKSCAFLLRLWAQLSFLSKLEP